MFNHFIEVFSILFVIIDPLGVIPVYLSLTQHKSILEKKIIAAKACFVAFAILLIFTILGDYILDTLHISEPAFRIAGAILLLITAIDMVVAHHFGLSSDNVDKNGNPRAEGDIAIFPLGMPLIAGPGGMVSVVMLMRRIEGNYVLEFNIILAMTLIIIMTYFLMICATPISKLIGNTGANILTRMLGIILAAIAIQFIINAINDLMLVPFMKNS